VLAAPASLSNAVGVAPTLYRLGAEIRRHGHQLGQRRTRHACGLTNVAKLVSGQYHCLAIVGSGPQPGQMSFDNLKRISNSFSVSTPSQYGHLYWLEYKTSLIDTNWKTLPLNLGISNSVTLTITRRQIP